MYTSYYIVYTVLYKMSIEYNLMQKIKKLKQEHIRHQVDTY